MAIENPPFSSMGRLITRSYFHWLFPILIYSKFRLLLIFAIQFIKFLFFSFFFLSSPPHDIYIYVIYWSSTCDFTYFTAPSWCHFPPEIFGSRSGLRRGRHRLGLELPQTPGLVSWAAGTSGTKWRGELAMNHGDLVTMVTVISGY